MNIGALIRLPALCAPALLLLGGSVEAAATQACDVKVGVIDLDPAGTHVRETPGGKIVATLRPSQGDDWIEVHVVGQAGDWFLIDHADEVGDDSTPIFDRRGYMHRSVLGADGLVYGVPIRAGHAEASPRILASADLDQQVAFLDCWHDFMRIRVKGGIGWTKELCLNQRTTCS